MIIIKSICGHCGEEIGKLVAYDIPGHGVVEAYGVCDKCKRQHEPDLSREDAEPDLNKEK